MSDVFDPLFVECRTDARTLAMAIKGGGSLAQQEVRVTNTSISLEINPVIVYKDIGISYSLLVNQVFVHKFKLVDHTSIIPCRYVYFCCC